MKVTKAQAQANRVRIVETASTLFREKGYDGIGIADLMAGAGFTHGGFYKHFDSKADLMAEAATCGIAQTVALSDGVDLPNFVRDYVSREHRDARASGCTIVALGADAARQPEAVRTAFADGIESLLAVLDRHGYDEASGTSRLTRTDSLSLLAHAIGALVLSRACPDDSPLADDILTACRDAILAAIAATPSAQADALED